MEIHKKLPTELQKIVDRMLHELKMLDVFKYLDYNNHCCYGCKQFKNDCEIYCVNYTSMLQNFCLSCWISLRYDRWYNTKKWPLRVKFTYGLLKSTKYDNIDIKTTKKMLNHYKSIKRQIEKNKKKKKRQLKKSMFIG